MKPELNHVLVTNPPSAPWETPAPPKKLTATVYMPVEKGELARLKAIETAAKTVMGSLEFDDFGLPGTYAVPTDALVSLRMALGSADPDAATHAQVIGGRP